MHNHNAVQPECKRPGKSNVEDELCVDYLPPGTSTRAALPSTSSRLSSKPAGRLQQTCRRRKAPRPHRYATFHLQKSMQYDVSPRSPGEHKDCLLNAGDCILEWALFLDSDPRQALQIMDTLRRPNQKSAVGIFPAKKQYCMTAVVTSQ